VAAAGPVTIAGRAVSKNDIVLISPWLLHRHEKLWHDPNAFMGPLHAGTAPPDRFAYLAVRCGGPQSASGAISRWSRPCWPLGENVGAFRVELIDREPVRRSAW